MKVQGFGNFELSPMLNKEQFIIICQKVKTLNKKQFVFNVKIVKALIEELFVIKYENSEIPD